MKTVQIIGGSPAKEDEEVMMMIGYRQVLNNQRHNYAPSVMSEEGSFFI